jgi:tRNA threonylcarbamoyladenosine biosynthesis protein TsaB
VDHLLRQASWQIKDIDGFAVAAGPGSFTGIRVGLSTIKAFAFASGRPIAAVSSLSALALKLREAPGRLLCPVIDAKRGEIYAALLEKGGRRLKVRIPQGAYSPEGFLSRLPARRVVHFIGNGVEVYKEMILAYLRDRARLSTRSLFIAPEVGILGFEILRRNRGVRAETLEPIYFRKSQAEEKR